LDAPIVSGCREEFEWLRSQGAAMQWTGIDSTSFRRRGRLQPSLFFRAEAMFTEAETMFVRIDARFCKWQIWRKMEKERFVSSARSAGDKTSARGNPSLSE
jgi:hypothetical protein